MKSCIHCHQVRAAQLVTLRNSGKPIPDEFVFAFPRPEVIGMALPQPVLSGYALIHLAWHDGNGLPQVTETRE